MFEQVTEHSVFCKSKTLVNGRMTDNIEEIRNYIMTKPMQKSLHGRTEKIRIGGWYNFER